MSTLGNRAYEELRRMLMEGEISPGTQLVNRKLADEIGFSMTPIREAINKLASEGLIDQVPGSGAFVRTISLDELDDLFEIRMALEPMAAAKAARNASRSDIAELRSLVAASFRIIRALAESGKEHASAAQNKRWTMLDRRIHEVIVDASKSPWLAKVSREMHLMAFAFARQSEMPMLLTVDAAIRTWKGHRRVVGAIARRDSKSASTSMRNHVRAGRADVLSAGSRDTVQRPRSTAASSPRSARRR